MPKSVEEAKKAAVRRTKRLRKEAKEAEELQERELRDELEVLMKRVIKKLDQAIDGGELRKGTIEIQVSYDECTNAGISSPVYLNEYEGLEMLEDKYRPLGWKNIKFGNFQSSCSYNHFFYAEISS